MSTNARPFLDRRGAAVAQGNLAEIHVLLGAYDEARVHLAAVLERSARAADLVVTLAPGSFDLRIAHPAYQTLDRAVAVASAPVELELQLQEPLWGKLLEE